MLSERQLYNLYAFQREIRNDRDILEDYVDEIALLHQQDREAVKGRFLHFLDLYHFKTAPPTEEERGQIASGKMEHTFIRISKPFRFREEQVEKMGATIPKIVEHFGASTKDESARLSILDFGGGGGNECIAFAKYGFSSAYSDLTFIKNIDIVQKRFEIRGLSIPIYDPYLLPEIHFDVITCFDVLEHLYDVEFWMARILARVKSDGLIFVLNGFTSITYDGDHLDKNIVYSEMFDRLMQTVGFRKILDLRCVQGYVRQSERVMSIGDEEIEFRKRLYQCTYRYCVTQVRNLAAISQNGKDTVQNSQQRLQGVPFPRRMRMLARYLLPVPIKRILRRYFWKAVPDDVAPPIPTSEWVARFGRLADYVTVMRIAADRLEHLGVSL